MVSFFPEYMFFAMWIFSIYYKEEGSIFLHFECVTCLGQIECGRGTMCHFESGLQETLHVSIHIFGTLLGHHENQARTRLECWKLRDQCGAEMSEPMQPIKATGMWESPAQSIKTKLSLPAN